MIIGYIIVFIVTGFLLGYALQDKIALGSILVISILWAFAMGPWAIATFIELLIGYAVAKKMLNT
jgi:hypothetical protein